MDKKSDNEFYVSVAEKAKIIARKLGTSMIHQNYYDDEYLGDEYTNDELKILVFFDDKYGYNVDIKMEKITLLSYYSKLNKLEYRDGKWTELIDFIYNTIPKVIAVRNAEKMILKNKIDNLRKLENYFKQFVIYDEKYNIIDVMNHNLKRYNISIEKESHYNYELNTITGYKEKCNPYIEYKIYYNNSVVAGFRGNSSNVFPNISNCAKEYVPGPWETTFIDYLTITIQIENDRLKNMIDSKTDSMLLKLKKSLIK